MAMVPAGVLKNFLRASVELLRVVDPGVPGARHNLVVLDDQKWVDWPSLERDLIEWMNAGIRAEEPLRPDQHRFLANGEGQLGVHIEYVVEDLWFVECLPAIINDSNAWESDLNEEAATAMLTAQDSGTVLPYGWYRPIR